MGYFGILSKEQIESELTQNLTDFDGMEEYQIEIENKITYKIRESEIKYLLFEKEIFEIDYAIENLNIIDYCKPEDFQNLTFDDFEGDISAPTILSLKTYNIIWQIFKHKVIDIKLNFFEDFRKISYGLNLEETKKNALLEFNKIYELIAFEKIEKSFEFEKSEKSSIFTPTPLYHLYRERQRIINNLDFHVYLPYLFGDLELYELVEYQNSDKLEELLSFQINLEILLELNARFNFEKDIYFNNIFYFRLKSISYLYYIKDTEPLAFCLYIFFNYYEIKATDVESMYAFLINNFFIGKKTDFLKIINENFKTKFTKIRDYETNLEHDKRVQILHDEWKKFKELF